MYFVYKLSMRQGKLSMRQAGKLSIIYVRLHVVQQIHALSVNWLSNSYVCSVTSYDILCSFTALHEGYCYVSTYVY